MSARRYILFAGASYYPCGGALDIVGFFPSTDAAKDHLLGAASDGGGLRGRAMDWWHVLDTETGQITAASAQASEWVNGSVARRLADAEAGKTIN